MYIYLGIFWKRTKSFFEHEFSDVSFILSLLQKKKKFKKDCPWFSVPVKLKQPRNHCKVGIEAF